MDRAADMHTAEQTQQTADARNNNTHTAQRGKTIQQTVFGQACTRHSGRASVSTDPQLSIDAVWPRMILPSPQSADEERGAQNHSSSDACGGPPAADSPFSHSGPQPPIAEAPDAHRRQRFGFFVQLLTIVLVTVPMVVCLATLNDSVGMELRVRGAGELERRTHTDATAVSLAASAIRLEASPSPVSVLAASPAALIPRPVELVGVPEPIEPILPARAPDGSYLPYHTPITDPIVYDVFSPPPAHPLKLLHARQALPALPSSYFGHRYIKSAVAEVGQFNNQRMMVLSLIWFGRLLNRTIVWPDHAPMLQSCVDLDRLGALHPLIAEADLPAGWKRRAKRMGLKEYRDVIYPSRADYESQPEQAEWFSDQRNFAPRFLHEEWGAGSLVNDRAVLVLDVLYPNIRSLFGGFTPAMHSSIDLWTMDAFRVAPPIIALMDRTLQAFQATIAPDGQHTFPADGGAPSFELTAGIHWRIGDYLQYDSHRPSILSVDAVLAWTAEVLARERAAGRDTSRFSVYIATQGEPEPVRQYIQRSVALGVRSVWLWSNFSSSPLFASHRHWTHHDRSLASETATRGIIEVILLAQPRYFLGTGRSTFSENVLRLRSTNKAHRADALQGLRRWDKISSEPRSGGFNAAVWPPDAYEPLPLPVECDSTAAPPAVATSRPVHRAATTVAALGSCASASAPSLAPPCDPPTPTVFVPYPGAKPPPRVISDSTLRMWRHAIAPAKRSRT